MKRLNTINYQNVAIRFQETCMPPEEFIPKIDIYEQKLLRNHLSGEGIKDLLNLYTVIFLHNSLESNRIL